ncbi:AN1-type zinc finger protein 5 [Boothiomyces macroporosus]|uniref:AN1-type zinc finger protein 5 n=1 Tax=Boothiomyces macroporosus TaxID=261099 RepID=A0AAD5UN52_9FUNG|nr:AN1-type zinc finger protein 5 [Boothiomyces macroporosus]
MKRNEAGGTDPETPNIPTNSRSVSRSSTNNTPQSKPPARLLTANLVKSAHSEEGLIEAKQLPLNKSQKSIKLKTPTKSTKPKVTVKKPLTMNLNVATMTGKIFQFNVSTTTTVGQLKEHIYHEEGIATESQLLVFNGKHLNNDMSELTSLGLREGSNLQLVLQMAGGPGPPIQSKTATLADDQFVFLLCKQNQEIYVLEVHLKDGNQPKSVTKHLLRLQSPLKGNKLWDFLGSNECFDISDMCELQFDVELSSIGSTPSSSSDLKDSRPSSGSSSFSYVSSAKDSRPMSGSSNSSNLSSDEVFQNLFWDNEWMLTENTETPGLSKVTSVSQIRPATAISLMRLPSGSRPMIIIPKTRPASAEKWIEGFKNQMQSHDSLIEDMPKSKTNSAESGTFDNESLEYFKSSNPKTKTKRALKSARKPSIPQKQSGGQDQLMQFTSKLSTPNKKTPARKQIAVSPRKSPKSPTKPITSISKKLVCTECHKKLGPAQSFICKCKQMFCSTHRYSDRHVCSFDYKSDGKATLVRNNPLIKNDKCIKL